MSEITLALHWSSFYPKPGLEMNFLFHLMSDAVYLFVFSRFKFVRYFIKKNICSVFCLGPDFIIKSFETKRPQPPTHFLPPPPPPPPPTEKQDYGTLFWIVVTSIPDTDPCKDFHCAKHSKCVTFYAETPSGMTKKEAKCECNPGFEFHEDGFCYDIDECAAGTTCSQICKNLEGGYKCNCLPGYTLEHNYFCRATSASGELTLKNVFFTWPLTAVAH